MFTKKDVKEMTAAFKQMTCPICLYQKNCHRTMKVDIVSEDHIKIGCDHYLRRPSEEVLNQVFPDEKYVGGLEYGR
jgi:hypothetical protein